MKLLGNYDGQTNQPTHQPTDGHEDSKKRERRRKSRGKRSFIRMDLKKFNLPKTSTRTSTEMRRMVHFLELILLTLLFFTKKNCLRIFIFLIRLFNMSVIPIFLLDKFPVNLFQNISTFHVYNLHVKN